MSASISKRMMLLLLMLLQLLRRFRGLEGSVGVSVDVDEIPGFGRGAGGVVERRVQSRRRRHRARFHANQNVW